MFSGASRSANKRKTVSPNPDDNFEIEPFKTNGDEPRPLSRGEKPRHKTTVDNKGRYPTAPVKRKFSGPTLDTNLDHDDLIHVKSMPMEVVQVDLGDASTAIVNQPKAVKKARFSEEQSQTN